MDHSGPDLAQNTCMITLTAILALSIAAFCVWLTVRIVNRRERWAKCALAVVLGGPVMYILCFGPACWFCAHVTNLPRGPLAIIYWPLVYRGWHYYGPETYVISDYAEWWGGTGTIELMIDIAARW
jgi:hypothetical protein